MPTTPSSTPGAASICERALARLGQDPSPIVVPADRRLSDWELDSFTPSGLPRLRNCQGVIRRSLPL